VYWGAHAKRDLSDCAKSLALELLKGYYGQISTKLLLPEIESLDHWDFSARFPCSGLHHASFFGIIEVVAGLIEIGCYDIDKGDFSGCTLLAWAAHSGHPGVVKTLLQWEEVNPNKPGFNG